MHSSIKNRLLACTALIAVSALAPQMASPARAAGDGASATGDVATGTTITATDAGGLLFDAGVTDNDRTITIDPTGDISFGAAGGADAITVTSGFSAKSIVINVTDNPGAGDDVTFAGDIENEDDDTTLTINIIDLNVFLYGDVSNSGGGGIAFNIGSSLDNPTLTLTVDTNSVTENLTIEATIDAVDAADVANLTILNTKSTANSVTFTGAIGGAVAIDAITVGADAGDDLKVVFGADVTAATLALNAGSGDTATVSFGTLGQSSTVTLSGAGISVTNAGTDNIVVTGGSTVIFDAAFVGANFDSIQIGADATDTSATFKKAIASGPITIGAGAVADTNTVTFDASGGAFTVTPTVNGGHASDINNVVVQGGNTITTAGAWGALLDNVTISGAGTILKGGAAANLDAVSKFTLASGGTLLIDAAHTLAGAIDGAGTLSIGAATTLSSDVGATTPLTLVNVGAFTLNADSITATTINFSGAGTISLDTGENITGAIITSANNQGTLTLEGASTITGNIGTSAVLDLLAINAGAGASSFTGDIFAGTLTFTGANTVALGGNFTGTTIDFAANAGTLTTTAGKTVTANITGAAGAQTVTNAASIIGNISLGADVDTLNMSAGSITGDVDLAAGANVVNITGGTFVGKLDGSGGITLTSFVTGAGADIVTHAAGAMSGGTGIINLGDGANIFTHTGGLITATITTGAGNDTININSGGNLTGVGGVAILTGLTGGSDIINLGATTITGNIGSATQLVGQINTGIGGKTTIVGDIWGDGTTTTISTGGLDFTGTLNDNVLFVDEGTLKLGDNSIVNGDIFTDTNLQGTLEFAGTGTINGDTGTAALRLKAITLLAPGTGETATFNGDVYVGTFTNQGTSAIVFNGGFDGVFAGNFIFDTDSTFTLADGNDFTGNIATDTDNQGTFDVLGDSIITGTIGRSLIYPLNDLKEIKAGYNGKTATFNGDVNADKLTVAGKGTVTLNGNFVNGSANFTADGVITLADNMDFTGAITTTKDNQGTLDVKGTSTITGAIGTSTVLDLKKIIAGYNDEKATFIGNIFVSNATLDIVGSGEVVVMGDTTGNARFLGDGILTLTDGSGWTGAITTANDGQGTLNLVGSHITSLALGKITGQVGLDGLGTKALKLVNIGLDSTNTITNSTVDFDGLMVANDIAIHSLAGTSTLNVAGGGVVIAGITGNSGAQTITLAAGSTIEGDIDLGIGLDTITNTDGTIDGNVALGDGDNVFKQETTAVTTGSVTGGVNVDNFDILTGSSVIGDVSLDDGSDTLDITGKSWIEGAVSLGEGHNTLIMTDGDIYKGVTAGAGDDTLTMTADSWIGGAVNLGNGKNIISLTASAIDGDLTTGTGNDTLTLLGDSIIGGAISTGAGNDTLNLTLGTVNGAILTGAGTDTINAGAVTITGDVGSLADKVETINAGVGGTTTTFNGKVFVSTSTLKVVAAGTANLNGDVTGNANFEGATGFINLGDGVIFTGAISNTVGGAGTLTLLGTSTVSGAVGSTGAGLAAVNAGADAEFATFNGLVKTTLLSVSGTGTVALNAGLAGAANFAAASTTGAITLADNFDITGAVDSSAANQGILNVLGTSTIGGLVGATNALRAVNAGATGEVATFSAAVKATTLTVTGTGEVVLGGGLTGVAKFGGDGVITLADTFGITGAVTTTVNNTGTLSFLGDSTVTGNVGTAALRLKGIDAGVTGKTVTFGGAVFVTGSTLHVTGDGTVVLSGGLTGDANFDANGVLKLGAAKILDGDVTTSFGGLGTLEFVGAGTITGDIGVIGGNELKLVTINAGAVAAGGHIAAATINFAGAGSLTIADNKNIEGAITSGAADDQGTLILAGTSTVTGNIGTSSALDLLEIKAGANGEAATFDGTVFTKTLTVTGTGAVSINGALTATTASFAGNGSLTLGEGAAISGTVTTAANNTGTLTFLGGGSVTGAVGASGKALKDINAGADGAAVTFGGDVFVATSTLHVTGSGTVALSGSLTGNANFDADGVLTLADTKAITGNVATSNAGQGTLTLLGGHTITGNVGALGAGNELRLVSINGAVIATGNIAATDITFTGASSLSIAAGKTVEGALAGDGAIQTLTNLGTIDGDINLGAGANVVTLTGGAITGNLTTLGGIDTLNMDASAITGNINLGNGDNIFDLSVGAGGNTITGNVTAGSGIDTLSMDTSTITGDVNLGAGANSIGLAYSSIKGNVTAGIGYDDLLMFDSAITGDVDLGGGTNDIDLLFSGITGNLTGGSGYDDLYMRDSAITGDVDLGAGNNYFNLTAGGNSITGNVTAGSGYDDLYMDYSTITGNVNLGDGDNDFDLDYSSIAGNVTAGSGNDDLYMDYSTITGDVDLGEGANDIDLYYGSITGNVTAGSGDDDLYMDESSITGNVDLGGGANYIEMDYSSITGNVTAGSGDDDLDMFESSITGNVDLGEGANYIDMTNSTITGDIIVGGGDDILYIDPSLIDGSVYLGNGFNQLDLIDSTITGNVTGGTGVDDVYLDNSIIGGDVSLDGGNDILTLVNNSLIVGSVDLGAGDDILNVDATSKIEGAIILGSGVNALTVNGQTLNADVTSGIDDDILTLINATLNGNVDLDGGSDTLDMTDSEIFGDVDMGDGSDFVFMDPSTIFGDLALGGGHNSVYMLDSIITGDLTAGSGNDYLKMYVAVEPYSVIFGLANLGDGDNIINMTSSRIDGGLTTGAGWDTLIMTAGSAIGVGVDLGGGNNTLTITDSEIFGAVTLGGGSDTVLLDPSVIFGDLILGGGDNILTLENSRVTGDVTAAGGDDKVYMTDVGGPYSRIGGNLVLGDGFNLVEMDYAYIGGSLTGGSGNDDLDMYESSIAGDVDLGDGSNYAGLLFSDIAGNLTGGSGYDDLYMYDSSITGNVDLGAGTNIITLDDSSISGSVSGGGDDTLDLVDDSSIGGNVGSAVFVIEAISGGSAGATATFDGDVFTDLLTVIGTGTVALGGDLTGAANFAADGVITLGDGGTITGAITTGVNSTGTLTLPGNGTVTGPVGDVGFSLLAVNGGGNGTTATFNGDIFAATLNVTGAGEVVINDSLTGTANFGGAGTLTLSDGATITGTVTTALDDKGTLVFLGSGGVTGDVGTLALSLNDIEAGATGAVVTFGGDVFVATSTLHVTGDGTVALIGSLSGNANFDADGEIELAGGESITGNLTASNAGQGALTLLGAATITGEIGVIGAGNQLGLVAINGGAVTTTGNIAATSINFTAGGSLSLAAGKVLEGDVTTAIANTGTLTLAGAATIIGDIGVAGGNELTLVTISAAAVTTSGDIAAAAINFAAAGGSLTLADGSDVEGAITNTTNNTGTLTLLGTSTVGGAVGTGAAGLLAVNAGATGAVATFDGLVKTTTLTVTGLGDVVLNAGLAGAVAFAANGELTLGDGSTITGAVTTTTNNTGTLTFLGSGGVTGDVGAGGAALKDINAGANGAIVTFGGAVFVATSTLHVTGSGTVALSGSLTGNANFDADGVLSMATLADITGNVATSNAGQGALTLLGGHTITGNVGALGLGNELRLVSINGDVIATGNIAATDITFTGASSLSIAVGKTVEGALTGDGAIQTLTNLGTIDGDINLGAGANVVTLTGGAISGNLTTLGGLDTLNMDTSAITGDVDLGNGDNYFNLTAGGNTITGNVTAGIGDDDLYMDTSSITGDVDLGNGTNDIDLYYSSITGNVTAGSGDDDLYMEYSTIIGDVDLDNGTNDIDLYYSSIAGNVTAGIGDDDLDMDTSAITGDVDLGNGTNDLYLYYGSITGNVTAGSGDDDLDMDYSTIIGDVDLGNGTNDIDLYYSSITGNVTAGIGDDDLDMYESSIIGNVDLGGGANYIEMDYSSITGNVTAGSGDDDLDMYDSSITGNVDLGEGANYIEVTNSTITGDIIVGGGDDILIIDPSLVVGDVYLGNGYNQLDLSYSTITGNVTGGTGVDDVYLDNSSIGGNVSLDGGNDILTLVNNSSIGGDVSLGDGDNTLSVDITSSIGGAIDLGGGTNTLILDGQTLNGPVTGGSGDDTLTLDTTTINGDVNLDGGSNIIDMTNSSIFGDVTTGNGHDQLLMDPSYIVGDVNLGDGNNIISMDESGISGSLTTGTGDDMLTMFTTVDTVPQVSHIGLNVNLGDGHNIISLDDASEIDGDLTTGIGSDSLTLDGASVIGGAINLGNGQNTFTLTDGTIGAITTGDDNDTLTLTFGSTGAIDTGAGFDTIDASDVTINGDVGTALNAVETINAGIGGATTTFNGKVFGSTMTLNVGAGTVNLNGDLAGNAVFTAAGGNLILGLGDKNQGVTVGGTITTTADSQGTLTLLGNGTVNGNVGNGTALDLAVVNAGATDTLATFGGSVFAETLNVTGDGTVALNGDFTGDAVFLGDGEIILANLADITGAITNSADGTGTLTILGTSLITGDVGAGGSELKVVNAGVTGSTVTFGGDVFAQTFNVTGTGNIVFAGDLSGGLHFETDRIVTLADNADIDGAVTTFADAMGTLTFLGSSVVGGDIGEYTKGLKTINVNGDGTDTVTLSGDVFVSGATLNITGDSLVALLGNFTGNAAFVAGANGEIELADGKSFIGSIATATNNKGNLTLVGDGTVTGNVGAAGLALAAVNAGDTGLSSFGSDVFATLLSVTGTGTVEFNGDFTGTIDFTDDGFVELADGGSINGDIISSGFGGDGTLTLVGNGTVNGKIGASGGLADIDAIFAGANDTTATFNDDVFADVLTVSGDGNVVLNDSFTGDATFASGSDGVITLAAPAASGEAFTGDITTFANNNGTLDVKGTIIIVGDVGTTTERLKKIIAGYDGQKATFIGNLWVTDTSLDIIGDGEVVITGDTTGNVNMLGGGTLTLSDGSDLDGNLITATQGTGTLNLLGDSVITGQIGDILLSGLEGNGNALAWISIGDGVVSVAGDIAATTINFTDALGELEAGVGANIEGEITAGIAGYGTLSLLGTNYVDGNIGVIGDDDGLNELLALDIFGPVLTNGHIAARTINLADADSALSVTGGKNVEGDINALIDGDGDLVLLGDHTIDGDIGDLGAGNQLNLVDISGDVVTTGHIAAQTINFTDTQPDEAGSLTVASSKDIEGDITTEVANTGTLILLGYHNITGNIGVIELPGLPFENELALVTINGPVLMDGDIAATTVNFAAAIGALTFTDGSNIEADITTATANTGSLEFLGDSTVTGNIGITGGRELALITIHSGVVTTDGDIAATSINFAADADATGTLSIGPGHNVTATITATDAGEGTLILLGDNTITGEIGVAGLLGNELLLITINDSVVTTGNISATTINFATEGELTVADGKNVETTDISTSSAGTGALMLLGDHTVAGDIGIAGGNELRLISINGDVITTGNIAATTINFASLNAADDDSLTIAAGKDVTAAITTATNDHGTLNFLGSSTVTGNVGASELRLQEINAGVNGATVTFFGDVFVTEATLHVTGDGTVELNGDFFGDANFDNNGTIVLGDAPLEPLGSTDFNGDITTSTDGEGTLSVFDTSTITGTVGTSAILDLAEILVDGGADDTATFDSDVFAEAINVDTDGNAVFNAEVTTEKMTIFAGADVTINGGVGLVGGDYVMDGFTGDAHFNGAGGTLTLGDDVDFDGDITTENDGEGTLTVAGTAVFTGTIGTDTKALFLINAGVDGETVTFKGAVYADTLTRTGTGTIIFEIGFNGTSIDIVDDSTVIVEDDATIDGDITTDAGNQGTVVFEGDSTVTGDVGGAGTEIKEVQAGAEAGDEVVFEGTVFTNLLTIGGGTVTLEEDFENTANFIGDGTLILANTVDPDPNFTGNITTDADNQGTLDVKGTSTITGNIGTSPSFDLKKIIGGYDGQTATFIGDIFVSDSTLDIAGSGTVSITGDTVGGAMFLADGTLVLESGSAWTGNINTANAGQGTLNLVGTHDTAGSDIVGNIGVFGAGNQLGLVTIGGDTMVDGDIASNTINFSDDFTLTLTDGSNIEGNITTTDADEGTLTLLGSSTITGNVGFNAGPDRAIALINAGAEGSTSVFNGDVNAVLISLTDVDASAAGTTNFLKNVTATTFDLVSGAGAGAAQLSTVSGDFTSGSLDIEAGAGLGADATLTLNGAANDLGSAGLNDGTNGRATLKFAGAAAQTVSSTDLQGFSAGEGALVIANSASGGVTFNDVIGGGGFALRSITIAKTGADSSATFMDDVSAINIILGDGIDANTNTVTFDATVTDFAVTGLLNGTLGDIDNVIVRGGGTVTANSVWGGGTNGVLSQVLVDGAGTILEAMANMTALQFTLANDGTLLTSAPVVLTGAIDGTTTGDGTGNLDIQDDTTVNGDIGSNKALTMVNVGSATLTANGHITAGTVNFEADGEIVMADNTNLTGNVTASASNIGTLTLLGDNDAGVDHTITGNIGNLTGGSDGGPDNELKLITIEGNVVTTGNIAASFITFDPTSAGSDYTTLTIADGKTIEGDITTTIANTGTLIFLGDGTVNGDVGTDALGLKAIKAYGGVGEVVTINGLVFVSGSTVEILGVGTVILTLDTEDAAMFFEDGTLQLNAGVDFTDTGVIATDAANQGTLTLLGHLGGDIMTIAGDIGDINGGGGSDNELKLINITGTVETLGNIAATNIVFTGVGSLSIAAGKTLESSLITGDGAAQTLLNSGNINSNINLGGGANVFNNMAGSTFTGSLNASGSVDMTVGAGAIATITGTSVTGAGGFLTITGGLLTLDANFSHGGVFTNNGVVNMNLNTLTVATHAGGTGLYEIDVLQTAAFDVGNVNAHLFGKMVVTGGAANFGGVGTSFDVNVLDDTIMAHGTEMLVASGSTVGPATLLTEDVTDNSALLDFEMISGATSVTTGDDAGDVYLRVFNNLTVLGNTDNNDAVGDVLALLGTAGDATLDTIQLLISDLAGDPAAVNAALDILLPTVDGAAVTTVMAFTNDTLDVVDHQLAGLRLDGGAGRGISAGNNGQGARFWVQAFGKTATQDPRDDINGYDADTGGVALGLDTRNIGKKSLFGVAFSYASTDADSDNAGRTKTEIDSYQITGYGDIGLGNNNYFSAMAAYAFNSNDTDRRVIIPVAAPLPPVSALATGSYDSDQFAIRAELGHDFKGGNTVFTPAALVNYASYSADDYTETGAGGASLDVESESLDLFELGLSADISWDIKKPGGSAAMRPNLTAGWRYDFATDPIQLTSRFTGGGMAFATNGAEPASNKFNLGAGVKYFNVDHWELTASYGYDFMSDYDAHSGMVRAGFRF